MVPAKGKYEDLVVAEDLKKKFSLTQDEVKEYDIKTSEDGRGITGKLGESKEFEFTELESNLLKKAFEDVNKAGMLEAWQLELYRMFVLKQVPTEVVEKKEPAKKK